MNLTNKELKVVDEPRIIIREDIRFGLFSRGLRKQFMGLLKEVEEFTRNGIPLDDLQDLLEEVKTFCEEHLKGKYTGIYIVPYESYCDDYKNLWFQVVLGRYETDQEYDSRIQRNKKSEKEQKRKQLEYDAKQYLKLKKKFAE